MMSFNAKFNIITFIVITYLNTVFCRTRSRITRGSSCSCKHRIQNERDNAVNNYNSILDEFNQFKELITKSNCPDGTSFNYDKFIEYNKIICDKCPDNFFRSFNNSKCLPCAEGYVSHNGASKCIKCRTGYNDYKCIKPSTSFCKINYIINNSSTSTLGSCIKCNKNLKEFIPYSNQEEKCHICPSGSTLINDILCIKCPIGTYEHNNKCIDCEIGYYADIEGSSKCMKCNNENSLSYLTYGNNHCKDSIFYNISKIIDNNIINIEPVINIAKYITIAGLNNDKILKSISYPATLIFTGFYLFS